MNRGATNRAGSIKTMIHKNPVKTGLAEKPEDYKYSSSRNYVYGDQTVLKVNVEYAGVRIV